MRSRWLSFVAFALFTAAILGAGATFAFAAPANDVFATVAAGSALAPAASGTIAGTNVGATLRPRRGATLDGNTASIWYKWIAPADDIVSFDTIGSIDPTGPEPLPTDVRAYTGATVGSLVEVPEILPASAT